MKGIDISHYNGWPFNEVTEKGYQESDFVIIKATQGTAYKYADYFAQAIARAYKDGKLIGAYHYAAGGDPVKEADYFLAVVNGFLGSVIIALDWEAYQNKAWGSKTWAKEFIDHIYKKTGVRCFLYTGNEGIRQCRDVTAPLWYARYPSRTNSWNVPAWTYNIAPWKSYGIWQYTDSNGKLDRNTTNMSRDEWKAYAAPVKTKEAKTVTVKIGSARIDERGKVSGGAAGDQTKNEVGTQNWYLHTKGWRVLRPNDPAVAEKIAVAMERACYNQNIGYDQTQRNTLYNLASKVGFDPGKVTSKCETDCSALVRVCLAYSGIKVGDFTTATERQVLLATGQFTEQMDTQSKSQDYMRRGDILVTKTKGHTVVVLSNGSKLSASTDKPKTKTTYPGTLPTLPTRGYYKYGDGFKTLVLKRAQIKRVQDLVNWILGTKLDVDGKYGAHTELAVREMQRLIGVKSDGLFGPNTLAAARLYKR